jgi:hypothetical protein
MSVSVDPAALLRFSTRWGVRFEPVPRPPARADAQEDASAQQALERVEALFDAARTARGALRPAEAGAHLEEAERLIRNHAELPQAAWLMAEHHLLLSEVTIESDPVAAAALVERARILEGERATAFGERVAPNAQSDSSPPVTVEVRGLSALDVVEWDAMQASSPFSTKPGEHQLRVLRGDRMLWAGWISVPVDGAIVSPPLPKTSACSAEDLRETNATERGPRAAPGTACPRWAVAKVERGELRIALCRRDSCGEWHTAPHDPTPFVPPAQPTRDRGFPHWVAYAAAGAGAALVAGLALSQSSAFSGSSSNRERWVYEGFK